MSGLFDQISQCCRLLHGFRNFTKVWLPKLCTITTTLLLQSFLRSDHYESISECFFVFFRYRTTEEWEWHHLCSEVPKMPVKCSDCTPGNHRIYALIFQHFVVQLQIIPRCINCTFTFEPPGTVYKGSKYNKFLHFRELLSRCNQGRSQPHSPGWARVPLSSFSPKFWSFFSYSSSNFSYFLPHFGPTGGRVAHPGRPWLRHWLQWFQVPVPVLGFPADRSW